MLKNLVAAVDQSPEILEKVKSFWRERLDARAALVASGIERGELPPDTDADLVIEGLLARIYLRVLLSGQCVTGDFFEQLINILLTDFSAVRPHADLLVMLAGRNPK